MGCYGTTGFLSRRPIKYGDEVVCFIASVRSNVKVREMYYPDSMVAPYALPIYGKYDDYGTIEDISRDRNVEILEKYFNCKIDDVLIGIERLVYGNTISNNIDYWKSSNNRRKMSIYEKILPLEKSLNNKYTYQWVLLFEHKDIYERLASTVRISVNESLNLSRQFDVIDKYKEIWNNVDKKLENKFVIMFPHIFNKQRNSLLPLYLETFNVETSLDLHKRLQNLLDNDYNMFIHEDTNDAFMAIFKQVKDIEDLFDLYIENRQAIIMFYMIWKMCVQIPMHFGLSHTGSQNYDYSAFTTYLNVINTHKK